MHIRVISESEAEVLIDDAVLIELDLNLKDVMMKTKKFFSVLQTIAYKVRLKLNPDATDVGLELLNTTKGNLILKIKLLDACKVAEYKEQEGVVELDPIDESNELDNLEDLDFDLPEFPVKSESRNLDDICYVCKLASLTKVLELCHRLSVVLDGLNTEVYFSNVILVDNFYYFSLFLDGLLQEETHDVLKSILLDYWCVKSFKLHSLESKLFYTSLLEHGKSIVEKGAVETFSKLY